MSRIALIATAALTFVAIAPTLAQAQTRTPDQRAVTAHVDFNDVNQTRFYYAKLQAAAHAVCASDASDPLTADADKACERQALNDAVRQVGAPQLSRLDRENDRADKAQILASNDR
ncbi:MAG: UrcA family protein [Asticcacaulis sp.]|uniref:UrcA family protein n=1 Tax=Asticcacaulis sp. TaxID=1872648 RepID=UPI003F7C82B9